MKHQLARNERKTYAERQRNRAAERFLSNFLCTSAPLHLRITFFVFLLFPSLALAQTDCPASVLLALARAGAACSGVERNQACYGNGTVTATLQSSVSDAVFSQPGHMADLAALQKIGVGGFDAAEFSVATLQVQANLPDKEQRSVTMLLFGEAEITNLVPPLPELTITSTGTLNVRTLPEADADILATLPLRGTATANGRTDDNLWLRVITRNNVLGWASLENLTVDGDITTLNVMDATTPFYRPFQVMHLVTGTDDTLCEGTAESGVLVQTPNPTNPVTLLMNGGISLRLAGTAYINITVPGVYSGDALTIHVLDGNAEVQAMTSVQFVPAGSRTHIDTGDDYLIVSGPSLAEPYDTGELQFLPINNLPYRFVIPQPLAQDAIDAAAAAWFAPDATPVPPVVEEGPDQCRHETRRSDSLWAGPGTFYEVVNEIRAGVRVDPVLQVTDAAGDDWWQLRGGNWILASAVETTGNCEDIPVTTFVQAPRYNELSLETCETTNGPLREGQYVEITFVPPAWHTYEDAYIAPRVDPGQITVDSQALYVYADDVLEIAEDRYIRVFETYWTATAGSHRIVGERLHYIITCNLTVPVG